MRSQKSGLRLPGKYPLLNSQQCLLEDMSKNDVLQVEHPLSKILRNLKLCEHERDATVEKFHSRFHVMCRSQNKGSRYVYKECMRINEFCVWTWVSSLIKHKYSKILKKSETLSVPSISDKRCLVNYF